MMIGSIIVSVLARKKPSTSGTAAPPEFVNRAAKRKRGRMDDTYYFALNYFLRYYAANNAIDTIPF